MADPAAFSSPALDVASDTDYDTLGDDYDGTALKATPTTAQIEQGFARPGHQLDAQHLNWLHNQFAEIANAIIGQLQRTPHVQVITETTASVAIPSWAKVVEVFVKGGGGGGGAGLDSTYGGGGGGSGYETRITLPRNSVPDTVSVVIGAGGITNTDGEPSTVSGGNLVVQADGGKGAGASGNGGDGYCGGGTGSQADTDNGADGGSAGGDGNASGGSTLATPGAGMRASLGGGASGPGGAGGAFGYGGGGGGGGFALDGGPSGEAGGGATPGAGGVGYGAGGGGASENNATGGAGADGVVVITCWGGSDE
jgi:hypothetical protein